MISQLLFGKSGKCEVEVPWRCSGRSRTADARRVARGARGEEGAHDGQAPGLGREAERRVPSGTRVHGALYSLDDAFDRLNTTVKS